MEDGSDERGKKADRKSGFNALCVVTACGDVGLGGRMDGRVETKTNDQMTRAAKNSSAHEIRVDH